MVKVLLRGVIISFIISFLLILIYSIILTYTNVSESTMYPIILIITSVSITSGALLSTLKTTNKGLVNGSLIGMVYIFILYLISGFTGTGFTLNSYAVIMMAICLITGMVGGIVGVNVGKK